VGIYYFLVLEIIATAEQGKGEGKKGGLMGAASNNQQELFRILNFQVTDCSGNIHCLCLVSHRTTGNRTVDDLMFLGISWFPA
jgi:hypothetical protein